MCLSIKNHLGANLYFLSLSFFLRLIYSLIYLGLIALHNKYFPFLLAYNTRQPSCWFMRRKENAKHTYIEFSSRNEMGLFFELRIKPIIYISTLKMAFFHMFTYGLLSSTSSKLLIDELFFKKKLKQNSHRLHYIHWRWNVCIRWQNVCIS